MSTPPVVLVVAKAPEPGRAKTRLAATVGDAAAADLAAAALLDTLAAAREAFGPARCHVAMTGDLAAAARADALRVALADLRVHVQRGDGFGERLVHAHHDVAASCGAPVVQVGMDTPQAGADDLLAVADLLAEGAEAVLGPAEDGGWWVLGLRDPAPARVLRDVPMSTARTGALTRDALAAHGVTVTGTRVLRDVDDAEDARVVAAARPDGHFGRAWHALGREADRARDAVRDGGAAR